MVEVEYKTLEFKFHRTKQINTISNTRSYLSLAQCPNIYTVCACVGVSLVCRCVPVLCVGVPLLCRWCIPGV